MDPEKVTLEMPGLPGHQVLSTEGGQFVPAGFVRVHRDGSMDRKSEVQDLSSFAALAKRYETDGSVVYWTEAWFLASLDDRLRRDFVSMKLDYAPEFLAWASLATKTVLPKDFRKFLEVRGSEVRTQGFLDRAKRLDMKIELRFVDETSSDLDMEFAFSSKEGDGTIKLPREVEIEIPMFRASPRTHRIVFDIEHKQVQFGDKQGIGFAFVFRDQERALDAALLAEVDALRTALRSEGFSGPVVRGKP